MMVLDKNTAIVRKQIKNSVLVSILNVCKKYENNCYTTIVSQK